MKHLIFLLLGAFVLTANSVAQGKSANKGKGKQKAVIAKESRIKHQQRSGRYSNHQPKKVEAALMRDYPNARNVSWRKYKGDYYATFTNGPWRSTATYHANGERRDTRTAIGRDQLPGNIWTDIFNRDRVTPTQFERIERPSTTEMIYRILAGNNTSYFYDERGNKVNYAY